jgi:hypothetical protein
MKKFLLALLITLMPLAAFAGGSVAVGYGADLNDSSNNPYSIEARWAQDGFYGAASYTAGVDWKTTTMDNKVTTTKEGEVDFINVSAGIVSSLGGAEVTAGGTYAFTDYGDADEWSPGVQVGASYAIMDNVSVGLSAQRLWTDRIGPYDSIQGQVRLNF